MVPIYFVGVYSGGDYRLLANYAEGLVLKSLFDKVAGRQPTILLKNDSKIGISLWICRTAFQIIPFG